MNMVEQYIQEHTRDGSNITDNQIHAVSIWNYHSWLTPDDAREVAKIAREEVIEKAVEWLRMNTDHYTDTVFATDRSFYDDFREAMKESI